MTTNIYAESDALALPGVLVDIAGTDTNTDINTNI